MLGAIIGDIVGSRWEFNPTNDYDFEFFSDENDYTDDTICTIAVADAILKHKDYGDSIHEWCQKYPCPTGGYGGSFNRWVYSSNPKPYGSYGNGAAMRVSPVAWYFLNAQSALNEAKKTAECTHNHPEGIKGAQAVAIAIHDCRELHVKYDCIGKNEISEGLERAINISEYNININPNSVINKFDETCQGTVPVAFWIIINSNSFEDAIRKAVSLGADADTLGAIVGSIAEVIWGIPEWMKKRALTYLPNDMKQILRKFRKVVKGAYPQKQQEDTKTDDEESQKEEEYKAIMFWKLGLGNIDREINCENSISNKTKIATSDDWKCKPMPSNGNMVSNIELDIPVSVEDMSIICKGHIPITQEDHWFMYCDSEYIRYYRSWTGMCAFEAHFSLKDNLYIIDNLKMNHELSEFGVNGDEAGAYLFRYLLIVQISAEADMAWQQYLNAWEKGRNI